MHIVLTHEQADFDALAALLGAHLMKDSALPVLPRRVNRNVRAFLNLHGADLPFIDPRDLPDGSIELITLVDTQSLVTLRGTTNQTRVEVVDHHQLRADLPESWSVSIDRTGATTTQFVESFQEIGLVLNQIQATLLLMGIYEDTGSLSYTNTTSRDVRAAAFLLEQGASLQIASEYLNPPLSADQRTVYERLLAAANWHHLQGQNIVVACSVADDMNEEISSVAHKIRDLLDPDALFLLVTTSEGIRLVARSTTDRIDVSNVAAHFGGGGHERAAAALIRVESKDRAAPANGELPGALQRVCDELVGILPGLIHPSVSVGQIMSSRPQTLSPTTSVQEAAHLMQRYGYEGYPVVKDGKVIGLLTRRAVDRALSHHLNLPAGSLMEAGEITVRPSDPLEHLQRVMTSSGWGQVPVVDSTSDEIIGIVTRTDLLKTLSYGPSLPARQNLADRVDAAMPPARLALLKLVAKKAFEQRIAMYVVGGFVRDLLLNRPGLDFDIVVEGDAIKLAHTLSKAYGGQMVSHTRFGTAKWNVGDVKQHLIRQMKGKNGDDLRAEDLPNTLDLISARTEFYDYPSALPTVERSSIKLDLHRRDFTINTLALRLDGNHYAELHDYWGGLNDLEQGLVRVLHSLSFIDDPTRMLRAVRFEQRFDFQIESRTLELMDEARELLKQVSGDRLRHELELMLAEEKVEPMLARLSTLGLLQAIHPDLPASMACSDGRTPPAPQWRLPEKYAGLPAGRVMAYLMWLIRLQPEQVLSISARLKLPAALQHILLDGARLWGDLPSLVSTRPSQIVARLEGLSLPTLYAAYCAYPGAAERRLVEQYVMDWQTISPQTSGETLRAMGVPPGPAYKTILAALREAWLDGKVQSHQAERELLDRLIEQSRAVPFSNQHDT